MSNTQVAETNTESSKKSNKSGNQLNEALKPELDRRENFEVGDTIKVHYKIKESGKERIQIYEGNVISITNKENTRTFTVRRVSFDVGVERIFPLFSPRIAKIELVRKGKVRRAKLYYLRTKSGKTAKIREKKGGHAIVLSEKKRQLSEDKAAAQATAQAANA